MIDCRDSHCPTCGHPLDCLPDCVKQYEACPWNDRAPLNQFMADKINADELDKRLVVV